MTSLETFNSSELLRDCYGLTRKQKKGSCWLDSTLEIMMNADIIGEIVRSEVFEYGCYKGKIVPYKVNINVIKNKNIKSFIFFIIMNFILFNLEITNTDKYRIRKEHPDLDICENSLENFLSLVRGIIRKDDPDESDIVFKEKFKSGGNPKWIVDLFQNSLPILESFIKINTIDNFNDNEQNKSLFKDKDNFLAASLFFKTDTYKTDAHVTSVIKCNDKIFYYDGNAPINSHTQKRTVDFTEIIVKKKFITVSSNIKNFWNDGLNYLRHYGSYFYKNIPWPEKSNGYVAKPLAVKDLYQGVILFTKLKDYSKKIPIINLDSKNSLKQIITCEFVKSIELLLINCKNKTVKTFVKTVYDLFMDNLKLKDFDKEYLSKYLKYKLKYLNLQKNLFKNKYINNQKEIS